jgi:carbon monoxide dehydrogenase subunit G
VKIAGDYSLPIPPDQAYTMLQDPAVLAKAMPGCQSLERIGDGEYAMRMKMVLASVSGQFEGKVRIADPNPPASFRLVVEGTGKIGFMRGEGVITLAAGGAVHYEGDVQVGGLIANIGQRLIETSAKMLIKRFFGNVAQAGTASAHA